MGKKRKWMDVTCQYINRGLNHIYFSKSFSKPGLKSIRGNPTYLLTMPVHVTERITIHGTPREKSREFTLRTMAVDFECVSFDTRNTYSRIHIHLHKKAFAWTYNIWILQKTRKKITLSTWFIFNSDITATNVFYLTSGECEFG